MKYLLPVLILIVILMFGIEYANAHSVELGEPHPKQIFVVKWEAQYVTTDNKIMYRDYFKRKKTWYDCITEMYDLNKNKPNDTMYAFCIEAPTGDPV